MNECVIFFSVFFLYQGFNDKRKNKKKMNSSSTFLIAAIILASFFFSSSKHTKAHKKEENVPLPPLIADHFGGFFSCVNVTFQRIIEYINKHKQLPKFVDASKLFAMYKKYPSQNVTFDFFKPYSQTLKGFKFTNKIMYNENYQFKDYTKTYDFNILLPLFRNYFTPSDMVYQVVHELQSKYKIDPANSIGVYYRGTDKKTETLIAPYELFYDKIYEVYKKNENMKVILQTDTAQFMDHVNASNKIPKEAFIIIEENAVSYTSNGIHNEKTPEENYKEMFYLFATFLLLAQSKHFVCSSGNCSAIMMLYRGHSENVYQILNDVWLH